MFEQICSVWRRGLLLWFKHICMRASHLWRWPCALCRAACRSAARPLRSAYLPPNLHDTAGAVSHTNTIKHIFKLHSLCNSLLMAASVTHFHFFISALGKLVNLISTQADNGELGGRNVTPSTTANHQSPVKYREEERRHGLCFKGAKGPFIKAHRCDSNISKILQTFLIIFLFNINCELRGAPALHECEGVGSVSVLIHGEEHSTSWGLFYSEFSEFFLYQRLTPIRSDLLIGGDSDAHPIMHWEDREGEKSLRNILALFEPQRRQKSSTLCVQRVNFVCVRSPWECCVVTKVLMRASVLWE